MDEPNQQCNLNLPRSVLIVGCGYIGSTLARRLLEAGVQVGALTRNATTADILRKMGVAEVIEAELDSYLWHEQLNLKYEAVVNCVSSAGGGLAGYQKSYVDGQRSLLEWAQKGEPKLICYTSSTSVYPQDGGAWVDETASTEPASETAALLLQAEQMLLDEANWEGRRYVLRLGGIYGPGRHYLIDQIKSGELVLPGEGRHHLNMIHCDDAVGGILATLDTVTTVPSGVYNVCDGQPSRKSEIAQWIATSLKVPCPVFDPTLMTSRLQRRGGYMPDRKISSRKLQKVAQWQISYSDYQIGYVNFL